jgi:hypothetical protein
MRRLSPDEYVFSAVIAAAFLMVIAAMLVVYFR